MMTGAFSRNVGKLFSELKFVTDHLLIQPRYLRYQFKTKNGGYDHTMCYPRTQALGGHREPGSEANHVSDDSPINILELMANTSPMMKSLLKAT